MSRASDGARAKPDRRSPKLSVQPTAKKEAGGSWFERLLGLSFMRKGGPRNEAPEAGKSEKKRAAALADISETASLCAALKALLDQQASSRTVLVHLVVLENALSQRGLKALQELPPDLLRRAMFQLETLVSDWSSVPLAALRAKLMAALVRHQGLKDKRSSAQRLSDFHDDKRMQAGEISMTTFMEVNEQWERSLTGG